MFESIVSVAPLTNNTSMFSSINNPSVDRSTFRVLWCCLSWLDRFSVFISVLFERLAMPIVFLSLLHASF